MVEADPDRRENVAAQKKAKDALAKLAAARSTKPSSVAIKKARASLQSLRDAHARMMSKLRHRALVVHRQNVHAARQEKLADADEAELLRQTHVEEYAQMSEGQAVAFLLDRCNAIDERDAKRAESNAMRASGGTRSPAECIDARVAAEFAAAAKVAREVRREKWRLQRDEMLGIGNDTPAPAEVDYASEIALPAVSDDGATCMVGCAMGLPAESLQEAHDIERQLSGAHESSSVASVADAIGLSQDCSCGVKEAAAGRDVVGFKRAREMEIYQTYKHLKGTGGNAIKLVMEKYNYRSGQRSVVTRLLKRAREQEEAEAENAELASLACPAVGSAQPEGVAVLAEGTSICEDVCSHGPTRAVTPLSGENGLTRLESWSSDMLDVALDELLTSSMNC
jgi:hypothetical protein